MQSTPFKPEGEVKGASNRKCKKGKHRKRAAAKKCKRRKSRR